MKTTALRCSKSQSHIQEVTGIKGLTLTFVEARRCRYKYTFSFFLFSLLNNSFMNEMSNGKKTKHFPTLLF